MKLKLTSKRTEEGGDVSASTDANVDKVASSLSSASVKDEGDSSAAGGSDDKWTKVFGKGTAASAPYQPSSRVGASSSAAPSTGSRFGGGASRPTQDARSSSNRYDDSSDPRFANLFSKGGDRDRDSRDRDYGAPGWAPRKIITTTAAMSEASRKAKEEFEAKQAEKAVADEKKRLADEARAQAQKEARAAKVAARDEADRKLKEKKEAAEREAQEQVARAAEETAAGAAVLADIVKSGVRGDALTSQLKVSLLHIVTSCILD
jgi:flagellar biosynthesis GTPase FlhF